MVSEFTDSATVKAGVLVEALPWIRRFKGKIFVIKLGGNAIGSVQLLQEFADDILFLHCVGVKPIVVFGGGPQISRALRDSGIESSFIRGYRVTPPEAISIIRNVLQNQIGSELQKQLDRHSVVSQLFSGEEHGLLQAERVLEDSTGNPIDVGLVGEVEKVNPKVILDVLDRGKIPILSSLAPASDGTTTLNVNADSTAAALAEAVGAEKLVLLTNVAGLYSDWPDNKKIIPTIAVSDLQKILPKLSSGMIPKMSACLRAVNSGVSKAAVIDGTISHSLLLEVFTKSGVGTEVVAQ